VHRRGFFEWRPDSVAPLRVARTERIYLGLDQLATWLRLPDYEGKPWPLSTHQGRKTFARFVALRDRTGLFALAQHLGHRERRMTDKGYVGNDFALQEEIEESTFSNSPSPPGNRCSARPYSVAARVLTSRPRFRGVNMKQDLRSFAQLLVQAGLTLGVSDWGFCVYRQEHTACLGSASEPNPIDRVPSTCVRCRNYVVTEQHRSYWQEQVERHQALLKERDLPRQTLEIARDRLTEATKVLLSLTISRPRGWSHAHDSIGSNSRSHRAAHQSACPSQATQQCRCRSPGCDDLRALAIGGRFSQCDLPISPKDSYGASSTTRAFR
jgi:hypothetical protein